MENLNKTLHDTSKDRLEVDKREQVLSEKDIIREQIRQSIAEQGPLHVPQFVKDRMPDYHLAFGSHSATAPGTMIGMQSLGYVLVSPEEAPEYFELTGQRVSGNGISTDGKRIKVTSRDQDLYLMKIPKERYQIINEIKREQANEPLRSLDRKGGAKTNTGGLYGDISINNTKF